MESFSPRRIELHRVRAYGDLRLKLYSVLYGPGPIDWNRFEGGIARAETSLPLPAVTKERPGRLRPTAPFDQPAGAAVGPAPGRLATQLMNSW